MEPITLTASSSGGVSPGVGIDIFTLLFRLFGGSETTAALANPSGILSILNSIWTVYAILAYIVSILLLVAYAYASTRRSHYYALGDQELRDAEELYDAQFRGVKKTTRLLDVLQHIESTNPNDWKLAIIEADIILDDILKQRGYIGASLGERLKSISPDQLNSLNDAWEAHKVRNRIAHDGADFVLTQRLAEETINRYRRVFGEFGVN